MSDIKFLKFNLQEKEYPHFSDEELEMLLEQHGDIKTASYFGCLMKANADDKLEIAGIKLESNRQYWITLAERFKPKNVLNYKTSMKRVDEK